MADLAAAGRGLPALADASLVQQGPPVAARAVDPRARSRRALARSRPNGPPAARLRSLGGARSWDTVGEFDGSFGARFRRDETRSLLLNAIRRPRRVAFAF